MLKKEQNRLTQRHFNMRDPRKNSLSSYESIRSDLR